MMEARIRIGDVYFQIPEATAKPRTKASNATKMRQVSRDPEFAKKSTG